MFSPTKEHLKYDPQTGLFTYVKPAGCRKVGDMAGCKTSAGYVTIKFKGKRYQAHVLAWYFMTDEWPSCGVDHEDLDKSNNIWSNLRLATKSQNASNAKLRDDNELGIKGIRQLKDTGKYQVRVNSKSYGCYEDLELAELVCREVRETVHGQFANHG